ncbi:MAG: PKD domain-containing protein [Bacteroidota bacterium]
MQKTRLYLSGLLVLALSGLVYTLWQPQPQQPLPKEEKLLEPVDHFFLMRSYPDVGFDYRAYKEAMMNPAQKSAQATPQGWDGSWLTEGPGNIGGRINVVAIHPTQPDTIYVGSAAGGIHKTTDGGATWTPIFDDFAFLAISEITLDPNDPETIYVGTGDHNISGYPFIGDGVYKSTNGGQTWTFKGLKDASIISRIEIDPNNSNIIYAAAMGLPFVRSNDRGLYKSLNGGDTWSQILFASDQAGAIDLALDPVNSGNLLVATWDRIRNNQESVGVGPNSKIWRSTNGGSTFTNPSTGLPAGQQSRIGFAVYPPNPQIMYALVVGSNYFFEGVYKTLDGGASWSNVTGDLPLGVSGGFGWYFGQIRVNPTNPDELFVLGVDLYRSTNGGTNWSMAGPPWYTYEVHADKHDLQYDLNGHIYLATDGGLYKSVDGGDNWSDIENIPNTQFYRVAVNPHKPGVYYGGAQDNGSTGGNAQNINNWPRIYGGDGFQMRFDPVDSAVFYAETQNGNIVVTFDGGQSFINHSPPPGDRTNWDQPFVLSEFGADTQYTGTYRIWENTGGPFQNWTPISQDLTDGVIFGSRYHTISTVNASAVEADVLYAGTSDGNVWVTQDNGATNWINITGNLPNRYVTCVKPSPLVAGRAFVSHSGYKWNEFIPHIHRTNDYGVTWKDISGDLPQQAVNDIYIYPGSDELIFVATDGGVYGTANGGDNWHRIGNNMPSIPVYDLEIDLVAKQLIAGTFARSIMTFPLDSLTQNLLFAPIIVANTGSFEICQGDTLQLGVQGQFASYLWSTGETSPTIEVTTAGTYTVTVGNGSATSPLSSPASVVVNPLPPAPTIAANGNDVTLCPGEQVILLTGSTGYNYLWSTGGINQVLGVNVAGDYSLQLVSSQGCVSPTSNIITVTEADVPVAAFGFTPNELEVAFSDQSVDAANYSWNFGDGNTSIMASPLHTYASPGQYTVQLIVSNDCGTDTLTQQVTVTAVSVDEAVTLGWEVFPNPVKDVLTIRSIDAQVRLERVEVLDVNGRKILESTSNQVDLTKLSQGMYLVKVMHTRGSFTQRIQKQ